MAFHPGDMLAGKCRIEAEIGHGAFGRVYRARDVMLDRLVAVKELDRAAADLGSAVYRDYVRRFQREAKIQARFNHPNIVHVYELIESAPGTLYLVMEHVDGGSLKELLEGYGALPINGALVVARQVLAGLAAVHADPRDIVHRDIKPSNVLLTREGQAKLGDFGLAQVGDESGRSALGQPHPGTALYMSPEQETSNAYLLPSSDLFSFGCVLFEMLAAVPYKSAWRRKQDLGSLRPGVPPWLAEVVERTVVADVAKRPESAETLTSWLEAGRPTPVPAPPATVATVVSPIRAATPSGPEPIESPSTPDNPAGIVWVDIPAGEFLYGDEKQRVTIPKSYQIGKFPVTNSQYQRFLHTNPKQPVPVDWDSMKRSYPHDEANHPVNGVSWEDTQAFCQWARCRLPTEEEWEKAARGTDGREYPWGNEPPDRLRMFSFDEERATWPVEHNSPVGDSPYGCVDMSGNIWEWTASKYNEEYYVLRGGSPFDAELGARAAFRFWFQPDYRAFGFGFRCAR